MTAPKAPTKPSVFTDDVFEHVYRATINVGSLVGGTPTDPKVIEGWIKSKMRTKDEIVEMDVQQALEALVDARIEEAIEDRDGAEGVTVDEAIEQVAAKHLNGFRRNPDGQLFVPGYAAKAMVKESANIRWATERWGPTRKGTRSFFAEHVFVREMEILTGRTEPDGVMQRFVHTFRGSSMSYDEYLEDVDLTFHIETDHKFTATQWKELWVTAQRQGIGATRSQGYGTFSLVEWERL